jgi:hypothetical protein
MRRCALALLVAISVAAAGCGGDDSEDTSVPPPPSERAETVQKLPKLPDGWKRYENRRGGFVVGLPPGWKASKRDREPTSLIRSYDRLVAISISPDRTPEGLDLDLDQFATRAIDSLSGLERRASPSAPRAYEHRYEAVRSTVEGKESDSGVRQRVSVIVLRRDLLVTFTVVIAANADQRARPSERLAGEVVATLRSRPPATVG